ncbi:MAG: ankyrin repeat domain-containing protein [Deltaproteobacteria bacterium]|nr:MAG: ankyrin repeat domain-containing protein [Deltaproteobacteria bacterium]
MFKILLVDRRPRLELTFKINFKTYLNAETESVNEDNWIMSLLPELGAYDMMIVNPSQFREDILQMIVDELESQDLGTTIIWLGESELRRDDDLSLSEVPSVKELLQKSATVLHITPEQMAHLEVPDYYPFPSEVLTHLIYLPCDIYHKVDNKMQLVIPKGGFLRSKDVEEVNKGFDEFFVVANERLNLTNSFTEQFMHLRQAFKSKKVDINERLRMMDNAMDYFSAEFSREGMTDEVIDMARDCIDSLLSLCNEFEMSEDLQHKLLGEEFSVQLLYAQIIIFISIHSSKLLGWIFEEPEKSIATAAFFHDLGLKSDKETAIRSSEELSNSGLDDLSKERVNNHAHMMATFLKQNKFTPDEGIKIVREHHGSKDGRGFNKDLLGISNISKIFIIAEEWANQVFTPGNDEEFDKSISIEYLRMKYPYDEYMQIIDTLVFLDAKELDEIYLFHKKVEEEDKPTLDDVVTLLKDQNLSETTFNDIRSLKFYMDKAEDVLVSSEKLNEKEKRTIKGVTDSINEFCQIVKGNADNPNDFRALIPTVTEKISTLLGKVESKEAEFNDAIDSARSKSLIGKTDLMIAIALNDEDRIKKIMTNPEKAQVNKPDRQGRHAIHFAAMVGNVKVLKMLIEAGAKVNAVDGKRRSPLFFAVQNDKNEAYDFLVEQGARPTQQALGGVNLAMVSAFRGNLKVLQNLLTVHGVNKNSTDMKGKNVEHYAKKGGHKEVIEYLKAS